MSGNQPLADNIGWPSSASFDPSGGELHFYGKSISQIVDEYQTPAIVYDSHEIYRNTKRMMEAFSYSTVYFAMKALPLKDAAATAYQAGAGVDVCSLGELELAKRAGIPGANILFHGNNKSLAELQEAVDYGVEYIVCDGVEELHELSAVCQNRNRDAKVLLRVKVNVHSQTHKNIATAHHDQKFGLADDDSPTGLNEAAKTCRSLPRIKLVGLHSHIGSQILAPSDFLDGVKALTDLYMAIRKVHSDELSILDIGGGFGVSYVQSDDSLDIDKLAADIYELVTAQCASNGIQITQIFVEPGRIIASSSCVTLYEVGRVKPLVDNPTYVAVDGGMSDNIRTALYDANYSALLANRVSSEALTPCRLVGKHCDAGDVIVREVQLPQDIKKGDLIAVPNTGAYCRSLANNYNLVPKPPVIKVSLEDVLLLQRRESISDLFNLDIEEDS